MIALIVGVPGAGSTFNFTELAGDAIRNLAPARKLALVPKLAPAATGMVTVAQFCAARGADLPLATLSRIGRKAAALSRADGLLIGRAMEQFGEVNTYDSGVLAIAFNAIQAAQ
jgi:hypothetical protein